MLAPQAQQQTKALSAALKQRRGLLFAGVVAVVAIVSTMAGHHGSAGDQPMSQAAQQARLVAFQQAAPLTPAPVMPADRAQALAGMKLAGQPAEVRQAIEDGREPLTWITLWDDQDEDGDTVEIISHGFSQVVRLTNAPQQIAVPVPEGGVINVHGVYDGGGGITVAIRTAQGQVALPVMAVGQVVGVPIKAGP